jgi:hypothetical protein
VSQRTKVEQSQAILAQIVSTNPEPLKLALYLVRPRTTVHRLLRIRIFAIAIAIAIAHAVVISTRVRLHMLARCALFAPGFQPHWIKQRSAPTRLCALASHVETLGDEPTRGGREIK